MTDLMIYNNKLMTDKSRAKTLSSLLQNHVNFFPVEVTRIFFFFNLTVLGDPVNALCRFSRCSRAHRNMNNTHDTAEVRTVERQVSSTSVLSLLVKHIRRGNTKEKMCREN